MSTAKQLASKATTTLKKASDSFFTELEGVRQKIIDLQIEIDWTRNAPLSETEAVNRIDDFIQYNRERFRPSDCLATLTAPSGRMGNIESFKAHASNGYDIGPMLSWLFPDQMRTRLSDALKDSAIESGLPFAERGARVEKLTQKLHALEVEEEGLIVSAEQLGLPVFRRVDASPQIVLGIDGEDEPQKPEATKRIEHHDAGWHDPLGNPVSKKRPIRTVADLPDDAFDNTLR